MTLWRERARHAARKSAQAEARDWWGIGEDDPIPFDYRWEHVQSVVGLAQHLCEELTADRETVEAAAWLHDVCKTDEPHEIKGAAEAARLLTDTDFPQEKIGAVVHAIQVHSGLFRDDPDTPLQPVEAAILWDADKLSKLGVSALAYNLRTPYGTGHSLVRRHADLTDFVQNVLDRTVRSMNTAPARRLAERRYNAMVDVLSRWAQETEEQNLE